jgi:hypothetical protein
VRRRGSLAVDIEDLVVLGFTTDSNVLGVDAGAEVTGDKRVVVLLDEETEATLVLGKGPAEMRRNEKRQFRVSRRGKRREEKQGLTSHHQ